MKTVKVLEAIVHVRQWTCPQCGELLIAKAKEEEARRLSLLRCENCRFMIVRAGDEWKESSVPDHSQNAPWRLKLERVGERLEKRREKNLKKACKSGKSIPAKKRAERRKKVVQIPVKACK